MEFRIIGPERAADIRLPNEAFPLTGRLIPTFDGKNWGYRLETADTPGEMCFPDENYDYSGMTPEHIFVGAYDGEDCVGLAVLREGWFRYMALEDLKVNRALRRQGIGRGLVEKALEIAQNKGYLGLYAVCQDNNLEACKFYLKTGFTLGGFDNRVYYGSNQADKADLYFYLTPAP